MPVLPARRSTYAIFVDAGYVLAAAGEVMLGTPNRSDFRVDSSRLVKALLERGKQALGDTLLRLYWFDAARDRVPTVEQREIASFPHVKVRLGNLNRYGAQKGVDALIRTDLVALARHRAVSDIILVAGDEDMVPAVEDAQAYGVRVHVWGVEPQYGMNQAERLIWEADTTDELARSFFSGMLTVSEKRHVEADVAGSPAAVGGEPAPTPATVAAVATPRPLAVARGYGFGPGKGSPLDVDEIVMVGEHIANKWLLTRGRDFLADLLPGPFLPSVVDKELLVAAEQEIRHSLRPYPEARARLRDGFWRRLIREFGAPDTKVS